MKNAITQIWLFFCVLSTYGQQKDVYQKAKIYYNQEKTLTQLSDLGISLDHGIHKKGYFYISEFSEKEIAIARNQGYEVDILIPDLKAHFLNENKKNSDSQRAINAECNSGNTTDFQTPDNFTLGSMGGYLTYQEVLDQLDLMRTLYPNLISAPTNISGPSGDFLTEGQPDNSVTPSIGGNGIKWVKISDNPDSDAEGEPQILHTSIHHAREPVSLMQLIYYMWYLLENYDTSSEIQSIVNNTEIYFVPVVNPDGYLYNQVTDPNGGGFWRKNRRNNGDGTFGVDNNRNYNFFVDGNPNNGVWSGPGSSPVTNSQVYHGTTPFSEVENRAIKWFVENHNFIMAFNNHTSGELLYYPHAYENVPTPDEDLYIALSTELVSQNGFTNLRDAPFSGDSDDFMYGTVGTHNKILAFTPEIGPSFWPPANQIEDLSKTMLFLNITAAKMVNNYAQIIDESPRYIGNQALNSADFSIKRLGLSGDGSFTVSINPVSTNIASVSNPVSFSNIEILETQIGSINYTLAVGTTAGDPVVYEIIVDNGVFEDRILIEKIFGALGSIFNDEANNVTSNFDNNGWGTTNDTFVSPSSSITDSPDGNYQNGDSKTITLSNEIDLTAATGANATFYARWEIENNWDYVQFEISTDGGNSWIPQCGLHTNGGSFTGTQPQGEPLYDGFQNDWVLEQINLNDYLGETILARFQFEADDIQNLDGFYFDDLKFNILEDSTLNNLDIEDVTFNIYPNPVEDQLNIFTVASNYSVKIYTLQGQLIREITDISGAQRIDYSTLSSGLYLMTLASEKTSQSFKIIKK